MFAFCEHAVARCLSAMKACVPCGRCLSITVQTRLTSPAGAVPAADEPDSSMQTLRDAYYFLQENGYINFGVLKGVREIVTLP
jgi:hypothetical protein